jgi:hypothetical protein
MSIISRVTKLEASSSLYVGLVAQLKEVQLHKKLGLPPLTLPKTKEELNAIISSSKNKLEIRIAGIYLRRLKA